MRTLLAALMLMSAAGAHAQTYVPGQAQANVNQFQLQVQADQLQQLQRSNAAGLSQPDPGARMQAQDRQVRIQQQIDQTLALRQQAPQTAPSDLSAQLQANGAEIQQLQRRQPIPPQP